MLTRVRLYGRSYCGHACAAEMRAARRKRHHDAADPNPMVCRCDGTPRPLEPAGPHCADCRRMFSVGLRLHLARRAGRHSPFKRGPVGRWMDELAAQLRLSGTGI
jgi:hypothetical protein